MPVTFDRFLRVVSGGKYTTQALFDVRRDKATAALNEIDALLVPFPVGNYPELNPLRQEIATYRQTILTAVQLVTANAANLRQATEMLDPLKDQARAAAERARKLTARVKDLRKPDLHYGSQEYQDEEQARTTQKPFEDWDKAYLKASRALVELPTGAGAMLDLITVVGAYITQLPLIRARVVAVGTDPQAPAIIKNRYETYKGIQRDCDELVQGLTQRRLFLQGMLNKNPTTERQVYQSKAELVRAAIRQLNKLIAANPLVVVLTQARTSLEARRDQLQQNTSNTPVKDLEKILGKKGGSPKRYREMLTANGVAAIANMPLITPDAREDDIMQVILEWAARQADPALTAADAAKRVKHEYHDAQIEELNGKQWQPINRSVQMEDGTGKPLVVQSRIIPASRLGNKFAAMQGKGVCSHDTKQYKTTVNLAATDVRNKDGEVLFQGLRHGINCAYGITPKAVTDMPDAELGTMLGELLVDNRPPEVRLRASLRRAITAQATNANPALLSLAQTGLADNYGIDLATLTGLGTTPPEVMAMNDRQRRAFLTKALKYAQDDAAEQRAQLLATMNGNPLERQRVLREMKANGKVDGVSVGSLRRKANDNRSMDIVVAALVRNPEKLRAALAFPNKAVDINISSLSLVTPDGLRGGEGDEAKMLTEQMAAWERVSAAPQPRKVWVKDANNLDVQVTVNINVLAFNFGVNEGAVGGGRVSVASIGHKLGATGWRAADKHNNKAMILLLGDGDKGQGGRVGRWLNDEDESLKSWRLRIDRGKDTLKEKQKEFDETPEVHPQHAARKQAVDSLKKELLQLIKDYEKRKKNRNIVAKLAGQIAYIWNHQTDKTAGNEPYKMPSRLAVLTYKMGDDAAFNCKSGKDRTGQVDVEAKLLATQIDQTGDVPVPDHELGEVEKRNRFAMAVNSGNHEMQQYNTGHMGFKLKGVKALDKSYPDKEGVSTFRGSSEYTKA